MVVLESVAVPAVVVVVVVVVAAGAVVATVFVLVVDVMSEWAARSRMA